MCVVTQKLGVITQFVNPRISVPRSSGYLTRLSPTQRDGSEFSFAGLNRHDPQIVRAKYLSMESTGWFIAVPLSFASLLTGRSVAGNYLVAATRRALGEKCSWSRPGQ